jgi:hypothetical protein
LAIDPFQPFSLSANDLKLPDESVRNALRIRHVRGKLSWKLIFESPLVALVILALPFQVAKSQEDSALGDYWAVYGSVNYSSWNGLGHVHPVGRGGPFDTHGIGFDFGGYTTVARLDSLWLLAGGELGYLGFNSDVIFEDDPNLESAFEVNHFAASIKVRFGEPGGRYLDLGVGLGKYYSDTKYIDCSVILRCFRAETGNDSSGTFIELSGTPGKGILVGARVHFVDFDPIEAVDLGLSRLEGPIYSIFVGWGYSNWHR